jgi:hypothetical protein
MARLTLVVALALAACSSSPAQMCSRDQDCQPGLRCADGVCTPVLQQDRGPLDSSPAETGRPDGGQPPAPDAARADGLPVCQPDHDDKLERSEMPLRVGASVKYSVGSGLAVDLQGTRVQGRTRWDLTASAPDEKPYVAELEPVAGWAAADFPGATYMTLLDAGYQTYGVFKATPTSLQLVGVISKTAGETKLTYSKPVDSLRFPVVAKDSYETGAVVTGPMGFFPYYASIYETHNVSVLEAGSLKLPELTLDVLLLKIVVKQNPTANPFLVTTRVSFLFVAECYGIVAQIFTDEDPATLSSVVARERRRISK